MKSEKYPRLPIARKSRPHLPQAPLRGRQSGSPTGQPYCTLAMSRPMIRLSSRDKSFSHSRTGSRLVADRQKMRGMGMRLLVIHPSNVSKKIQKSKLYPTTRAGGPALIGGLVHCHRKLENKEPVHGTILAWTADEIVIRHEDLSVGKVNVHFPRVGFDVAPAQRLAA
jgi:hypothetical protein